MLILLLLLVFPNSVESYPAGQCNKKDSSGRMKWFCCNNHEEVNGNCIKCVKGFESFDGSPCMPCPKGLWGEDCANRCSCTKDQICDHILGCINIQIDMPEETTVIAGKTDRLKFTSTMTDFSRFTTFIKPFTNRGEDPTVRKSTPKTTSTTSKSNKNNIGLHNEIFIYSVCAGAFAFAILLCTVCKRRYKQIQNYLRRITPDNGEITNVQEIILDNVLSVEIEGIYEVIDESNMIDNFGNTGKLDDQATKNETEGPSDSNTYPNRYRLVKKDPNINNSNRRHTDQLKYSATIKDDFLSTTFSYRGKYSNVKISIKGTTSSTPNHKIDDQGLSTTALVAFSICAVMFVLFVILGCVCQRRYTKIYDIFKIYQTGHSRRRTTDHPLHEIPLGEIEGIYEEIDEMNMTDNVGIPRDEDMSVDDTNGSYVQPDNNGYLTPFQPDDEYTSTDNSNDNKSQSLASTHDSHSFPIDHLSTSSSSDVQERRSSYLNPYQPIVHSADIHEYSSIHIINESSSSGSETQLKGSGYLNPYQPMVSDFDLHDYKSVQGCSSGSFSPMLDACTKEIVPDFPQICQSKKIEIDTQNCKSSNDISSETVLAGITSTEVTSVFT